MNVLRLVLWAVFIVSWHGGLRAEQIIPLNVDELSRKADLVVQGKVTQKICQRDPEGRLYTQISLQLQEVWKGQPAGNPLSIVHGGGKIGSEQVTVSHQVSFELGEEVVVFLVLNPSKQAVCLGMAQGKFSVWHDKATDQKFVLSRFHGAGPSGNTTLAAQKVHDRARIPLADLKHRVVAELQ